MRHPTEVVAARVVRGQADHRAEVLDGPVVLGQAVPAPPAMEEQRRTVGVLRQEGIEESESLVVLAFIHEGRTPFDLLGQTLAWGGIHAALGHGSLRDTM